jgi:ABC-2 type transport system ATP-binding protein
VIQVEKLTKKYADRFAVREVSFQVPRGEVVGFLGPNGAGKTTTLRMLTGYLAPDGGRIRVDGIDVVSDPVEARRRIGYMPETVPLYRELRVEEYLRYRARLKEVGRKQLAARVKAAMEMARITEVRSRIVGQLSRGYRSRVGLADALVADPPLLVLDEPTAGLDPNQIRQVRNLIRDLAREKTVLLSSHILPEVESTCGHVLIINEGRLVGEGAPGDLRIRGQGGQVIAVEGRGERSAMTGALQAVAGVRGMVEVAQLQDDGPVPLLRISIEADPGPEVPEAVFTAMAEGGFKLRELRREQTSLEDVFASLTMEEAQAGDADAGESAAAGNDDEQGSEGEQGAEGEKP